MGLFFFSYYACPTRKVDLATKLPYVRAGAILPLEPARQFTGQPVSEPTTLIAYPGADGAYTFYDDDGKSQGYRDGSEPKTVWIRLRWDGKASRLPVEPDPRMKQWPGGVRIFAVEAVGGAAKPKQVELRGEKVTVDL